MKGWHFDLFWKDCWAGTMPGRTEKLETLFE
jgi:hypothetical protein